MFRGNSDQNQEVFKLKTYKSSSTPNAHFGDEKSLAGFSTVLSKNRRRLNRLKEFRQKYVDSKTYLSENLFRNFLGKCSVLIEVVKEVDFWLRTFHNQNVTL